MDFVIGQSKISLQGQRELKRGDREFINEMSRRQANNPISVMTDFILHQNGESKTFGMSFCPLLFERKQLISGTYFY